MNSVLLLLKKNYASCVKIKNCLYIVFIEIVPDLFTENCLHSVVATVKFHCTSFELVTNEVLES